MTNETMVRGAKSGKIGKTLTGYLILSADGGRVGGPDIQQSLYLKTCMRHISLTKSDANIDSCRSVMGKPK